MDNRIEDFGTVLQTIVDRDSAGWLFLPSREPWGLKCKCLIEEAPELSDLEADSWLPDLAREHGLQRALPVADVQDIVLNATEQKPDASIKDLFRAFVYYYDHDAFIGFPQIQS